MAADYTGPVTRKRLADSENETSPSAAASVTNGKPKELRHKVNLLVHELKTNTVDSPHHWGWLHLRIANLSTEECEAIVDGLKLNKDNVEWLDISPINISYEGLACIIDSLKTNQRITKIQFCGKPDNDLYDEEDDDTYLIPVPAQSLSEVLKVNKSIHDLVIADSTLTDDDVKIITNELKMNSTLTDFSLENNLSLTIQSAHYLSDLIKSTKALKKISLGGKPIIDDEWVVLIASSMKINRSIEEISIHDSQFGDEGVKAFGEMLAVNQTLTTLRLFAHQITDVGAKALTDGLKHNTTFETLSVSGHQLSETSEGRRVLLEAKNEIFKYLYLN